MTSKSKISVLDKPLGKPKGDVNLSTYAFLISEMVQYSQKRAKDTIDFQNKMIDFGRHMGVRLLDFVFLREKKDKREIKIIDQLTFIKKQVWKTIYSKELDRIQRNEANPLIYYLVELEPVVNRFLPKDRIDLAYLNVGIIDAILNESNFPCKVDLGLSEGEPYYQVTFKESILKQLESK